MKDRQDDVVGANAVMAVSFVAVCLRYAARRKSHAGYWWDDWLVFIALILAIAGSALQIYVAVDLDFGVHQTDVPEQNVLKFLRTFYAYVIMYLSTLAIIECAILFLYRRVFPVAYMKRLCTALQALVLAWAVAIILVTIFQCHPVRKAWNPTISGKCVSEWGFLFGMGLPSVITDWLILLLPVRPVLKLHMPFQKKLSVAAIFMLGGFAAICSVVRLAFVMLDDSNDELHKKDITYYWSRGYYWSSVEIHIALVCACLPTFGVLIRSQEKSSSGGSSGLHAREGYFRSDAKGYLHNSTGLSSKRSLVDSSGGNTAVAPDQIGVERSIDVELEHIALEEEMGRNRELQAARH